MSPRKSEVKTQSFARGRLINNYVSKLCEFCCRFFTEKFTYFLINSSKLIETHQNISVPVCIGALFWDYTLDIYIYYNLDKIPNFSLSI